MLRDRQWEGQPAYVVGGGPSLRGFQWELLQGREHLIVINAAMLDAWWAEVFFTEDLRFIERFCTSDGWRHFRGVKVFHALEDALMEQALRLDPTLLVLRRTRPDKYWSPSLAEGLSFASNSGVGAINLACILGADPIYLLGFDCRPRKVGEPANYHDHYPQDWRMPLGQELNYRSDFEHWVAPHTSDRRVINLTCPQCVSAITCWPRWDRDSFLRQGAPGLTWDHDGRLEEH